MVRNVCFTIIIAFLLAGFGLTEEKKDFTADRHKKLGLACDACHGSDGIKKIEKSKTCLACHKSMETVAAKTKDVTPNPHQNHFVDSNEIQCVQCHQGHKADIVACQQCHSGMNFERSEEKK